MYHLKMEKFWFHYHDVYTLAPLQVKRNLQPGSLHDGTVIGILPYGVRVQVNRTNIMYCTSKPPTVALKIWLHIFVYPSQTVRAFVSVTWTLSRAYFFMSEYVNIVVSRKELWISDCVFMKLQFSFSYIFTFLKFICRHWLAVLPFTALMICWI